MAGEQMHAERKRRGALAAAAGTARKGGTLAATLATLAALGGVVGCGGEKDPEAAGSWTRTAFRDSAGVRVAVAPGVESGVRWRLVPELTIGARDGEFAFGDVADVARGPDGRLFVLDRQEQRVRIFGPDGGPLGALGGEGEGPGEFRRAARLFPLVDGGVAVAEGLPARLHFFGADGTYRRTRRLAEVRPGSPAPAFAAWWVTAEGEAYAHLSRFAAGPDGGPQSHLLRLPEDAPADTLAKLSGVFPVDPRKIRILDPRWVWAVRGDGGFFLSPGLPYEVRVHGRGGALELLVRRPLAPIPVTAAAREAVLEGMRRDAQAQRLPESVARRLGNSLAFADQAPPVAELWSSEPGGRFWVGVRSAESVAEDPDRVAGWDVYGPAGAYLGHVRRPAEFGLRRVMEDAAYGVWRDELGVSYARRYRLEAEPDAGT